MSYVKFGWDGSEVYLYGSSDWPDGPRTITCSGCLLYCQHDGSEPWLAPQVFYAKQAVLDHLQRHQEAGHVVPETVIAMIEGDDWIE